MHVINCWSGPRSLSTSLMYAFHNRGDVEAHDEPLYAHWLDKTSTVRPYRDAVLAAQDKDGSRVVLDLLSAPCEPRSWKYAKHMAKHIMTRDSNLGEAYERFLRDTRHFILIRNPDAVARSFAKVCAPSLEETCLPALCQIFSDIRRLTGVPPPVVSAEDLQRDPEGTLRELCAALDVDFKAEMLRWDPGPRPEIDGVWASWWYGNTHKSSGFTPRQAGKPVERMSKDVRKDIQSLVEEARPFYYHLKRYALKPMPPGKWKSLEEADSAEESAHKRRKKDEEKRGTHAYAQDPRNAHVLIGMRDGVSDSFDLVWRPLAKVSVFDSGFVLGDGVWEGIRLHGGVLLFVKEHLRRLYQGAKAIDMDLGCTPAELEAMVYQTVDANDMRDHVHIRLMVTRGLKPTPYQNPATTIGKPTIVIAAEHKAASEGPKVNGISLMTCHVRRGAPDVQDPAWNSHSKLNCIAACIQANKAGVDESLMLDPHGFVATCNSVHFFIVVDGVVMTSRPKYILHGITRANVMKVARDEGMEVKEDDFTLTTVYSADEAFVTGTFAGVMPVTRVDGRVIGGGGRGPVVKRLQEQYVTLVAKEVARGRGGAPC